MSTNWSEAAKPLLKKYKRMKHPLDYKNSYQLLVMVVLAAQASDKLINEIAPAFFKVFPNMQSLSKATVEMLVPHLSKVRNHRQKSAWLVQMATIIKKDSNIPLTLEGLVDLPGIGRKSANVILRECGKPAEGVMVDLHTVRVAPRLGMVDTEDPKKIEQQLMEIFQRKQWDIGMCLSFHGREICRPKPMCDVCFVSNVCEYYQLLIKKNINLAN